MLRLSVRQGGRRRGQQPPELVNHSHQRQPKGQRHSTRGGGGDRGRGGGGGGGRGGREEGGDGVGAQRKGMRCAQCEQSNGL